MMSMRSACIILPVAAALASQAGARGAPLTNAGFEQPGQDGLPAAWGGNPRIYSRDTSVSHTGRASLKYVNDDPKRYQLCGQPIRLEPGHMYAFSAWVKTKDVKGKDSGATLCVEWSDAQRKYIGGSHPPGVRGTNDWTLVKGLTRRIPDNARNVHITCYLRKGMTGTAWWDDVSIRRHRERPLSAVLTVPNYRGWITPAGPKQIEILCELNLVDYELTPEQVGLGWSIVRESDNVEVARGVEDAIEASPFTLRLPTAPLTPGEYAIDLLLSRKGSSAIGDNHRLRVVRLPADSKPIAMIDEHNRLILRGKPFFPLGTYWGTITEEDMAVYADSPFNCLMPYHAPDKWELDLAHKHGKKVIYSVKDIYSKTRWAPKHIKTEADELAHIKRKVRDYAKHPAVMAWYLNDELPISMLDRLERHQQWLEELDPDHPTWVVLYQVDQVRGYIRTFDAIGTDPYPIPKKPPSLAGEWTRQTVKAVAGARPVWMVPQIFNWGQYRKDEKAAYRPPTYDEMRSMAWQCIAEGANGLIFYAFHVIRRDKDFPFDEHWPKVQRVAAEIEGMIPVLLSVRPTPTIKADPTDGLRWTVRQHRGTTYLITVNDRREALTADLQLPARPASVRIRDVPASVSVGSNRKLSVQLDPLGMRIYEIKGLPIP